MIDTNQKVYHELENILQTNQVPIDKQQAIWLCFISRCIAQMADDIHEWNNEI